MDSSADLANAIDLDAASAIVCVSESALAKLGLRASASVMVCESDKVLARLAALLIEIDIV